MNYFDIAPNRTILLFRYYPNKPLPIVSLVVFILFALYLTYKPIRSKSRLFLFILPFTALMECVGYILRYMSADDTTLLIYIIMTLFLLLPPNALALVNYKATGDIIQLSNVHVSKWKFYLKPKFITWFFFTSDFLAFFLQGCGGALQSRRDLKDLARYITIFGLAVQLCFLACYGYILYHVSKNGKYQYVVQGQANPKQKLIRCLAITLVLLYIRSIYRFAEYVVGYDGVIARAEWAFYVFDTLAIAAMFLVYSIMYIGNYLPKRGEVNETHSEKTKVPSESSLDNLNQLESGEVHQAKNIE